MRNHQTLFERVREHNIMAEKFHQVEVRLLSTLDFRTFFQSLVDEIRQAFDIPHVWFTLIRGTELEKQINSSRALGDLEDRLVRVAPETYRELVGDAEEPLLINQETRCYAPLFPKNLSRFVGSLSLVPIRVDGELVGCLNQADQDPNRYRPGLNTLFLERLAIKMALGLSNVSAHEKLKFLAYHDPLTQLLNRRVMETILERELNRSQRYGGILSLAFIDLDAFKQVNDSYGHDVGDQLLQYVAKGLSEAVRMSDVVTRYAGDEFVVILPETSADNARRLMARIQQQFLGKPLVTPQRTLPVRLSAGVASTEAPDISTSDSLLRAADQALYLQKKGR